MASTKGFLEYVLEQLSPLGEVSFRPMMGEYLIYYRGAVIGGVYDDRFLVKPTENALLIMSGSPAGARMDVPYPGGRQMLTADVDDRELTCRLVSAVREDLPDRKKK